MAAKLAWQMKTRFEFTRADEVYYDGRATSSPDDMPANRTMPSIAIRCHIIGDVEEATPNAAA